jgi:glutamate-5-semialdehyde dehydrogenase
MATSLFDLTAALSDVRQAAEQLSTSDRSAEKCSQALGAMGEAIAQRQDDILEANTLDLEISRDMAVPELVVDWLKLTPERLQTVSHIFNRLALMGATTPVSQEESGIDAYYRTSPIGIVGFIYEAFPDLGAIAAALCIRTGNALVLKGGSEASRSNEIIASILQESLTAIGLPPTLIYPIESTEISRLDIAQCPEINLIIPHGRPSLVEQVVKQASVPVIPSRMGNCYLYWSASGSLDRVYHMIVDSHAGTPDAVNRIEKVLVHESHSENAVTRLWNRLHENGFQIKVDDAMLTWRSLTNTQDDSPDTTDETEWKAAYLRRTVAFRQVKDSDAAIRWINLHSSGHADSIATADYGESRQFVSRCRSAAVYLNTSPRFIRNAQQARDIALGASDYKVTGGGMIGMAVMQARQRIFHGA